MQPTGGRDESKTTAIQMTKLTRRRLVAGGAALAGGAIFARGVGVYGGSADAQNAATPGAGGPIPVNPQVGTAETTTILNPGVVSWVHFGDLHITTADQQNYLDFQTIIANTNQYLLNGVNFAVLPGDNANDGTESEYQLIKAATDQLKAPLYAVPGDHDHKTGLAFYHQYLESIDYQSFSAGGYHFVFLDVMAGISADEQAWATCELDGAKAAGLKSVIVMHSYTAATQLQDLIQRDDVIMVDSGHTHYNDVANDGHTNYAAGRNTGQVTEGPVGFVIANLDNGVVSWKFKPLGSWPFVMITSPSDKLLMIDRAQAVNGKVDVRVKIWDDKGVADATMQIDGGAPADLQRIGSTQMWSAPFDATTATDGDHRITVNVQGAGGNTAADEITIIVDQADAYQLPTRSFGPSGNSIGAYADKGLLGNHAAAGGSKAGAVAGGKSGKGGHGPATVVSVEGNTIAVKYKDGSTQQVLVTSATQITKVVNGQNVAGILSDLQAGETVDVRPAPGANPSAGVSASPAAEATPGAGMATATQIKIHMTTIGGQGAPSATPAA